MSRTVLGFHLLLFSSTLISSEVSWVLRTVPVVFGENVVLFCSLPDNFDKSLSRQWKIGSRGLTLNEGTTDRNKYNGSLEEGGFTLTIKQFQVEDFGIIYTCTYGFESYKANLSTENYLWIPQPDMYEVDILCSTIEMIKFTLQFQKVYPEPNCTSLIGHNAIPAGFIVSSHVEDRYFLATNLTLEHKFDLFDCGEEVSILCKIGNTTKTLKILTHRQCADVCQRFSPCLNDGTCESNRSTIQCGCMDGFNGNRCENMVDHTVPNCPNTTGLVVALVISLLCLIAAAAFFVVNRRKISRTKRTSAGEKRDNFAIDAEFQSLHSGTPKQTAS